MPLQFLRDLENATLPLVVTDSKAMRNVALLRGAGLINATMRKSGEDLKTQSAVVLQITGRGQALLQLMNNRRRRR